MSINPLSSGQGDSSAKQQELNVPFDMGQNGCWITSALSSCRSRCELRSYGGAERERGTDEMVAPVQVPVSPELNCGGFYSMPPGLATAGGFRRAANHGPDMHRCARLEHDEGPTDTWGSSILQLLFLLFWRHIPLNPHARH